MRKSAVLTLITVLAIAAAGSVTSVDAMPAGAKKTTKGAQQQQYLQIKMQDVYISSARSAPSKPGSTGRPSGTSRR